MTASDSRKAVRRELLSSDMSLFYHSVVICYHFLAVIRECIPCDACE